MRQGSNPTTEAATTDAEEKTSASPSSLLGFIFLFFSLLLASAQLAGVLLRDKVEGRLSIMTKAPVSASPEDLGASKTTSRESGKTTNDFSPRFGPGVQEVAIASGSPKEAATNTETKKANTSRPPVAEEAPSQEKPPPQLSEEQTQNEKAAPATATGETKEAATLVEPPTKTPEQIAEKSPKKTAPANKTHVLQVGVFRSQAYRLEEEAKLKKLQLPYFYSEKTTKGSAFKLAVLIADSKDLDKAGIALKSAGYAFQRTNQGVEAFFYLETEAQKALNLLSSHGFKGGYGFEEKYSPVWTLYAGPFSMDEASKNQEILKGAGIKSYLKAKP